MEADAITGEPNGKRRMSGDQMGMIWHTRCGSETRRGQWMDVEDLVGGTEIRWWDVICRGRTRPL
jgi:hypothetical protein